MSELPTLEQLEDVRRRYPVEEADVRAMLARVPPSWALIQPFHSSDDGAVFRRGSLQVIISLSRQEDGRLWVHVSACGRTGSQRFYLPTWEELKRVKDDFIGRDAWAYQVLPTQAEYINHHQHVLHLFALMDGKPALPDFTRGLGTL